MSCVGCKHDGKYARIPCHWCEATIPGRLNKQYPKPFDDCPEGRQSTYEDTSKMEDYW